MLTIHSRVPKDFQRFGTPGYAWVADGTDATLTTATNMIGGQAWLRDDNGDYYPNAPANVTFDPVWEYDEDDNLKLKAA